MGLFDHEERKKAITQAAIDLDVKLDWEAEIKPGDMYLAQRNGPAVLLTARKIDMNCIFPEGINYPYEIWECVRIVT